jgi:hypothetical protein
VSHHRLALLLIFILLVLPKRGPPWSEGWLFLRIGSEIEKTYFRGKIAELMRKEKPSDNIGL